MLIMNGELHELQKSYCNLSSRSIHGRWIKRISPLLKLIEHFVDASSNSKDQICSTTKICIAESFKFAEYVIELDYKEDEIIIGNRVIRSPLWRDELFSKEQRENPIDYAC